MIIRKLCLSFFTVFLFAVSAQQASAQQISPQEYIDQYKTLAIRYMEEHGCPASIVLAIAMHESAYGNSRVARYLNNHFGIKGPNSSTEIRSAYKGYDSVEDSYQDFIDFLKRRPATARLFEDYQPHEYRRWVNGIARSGYAHSPAWSAKVLGMIQRYNLHEFDLKPENAADSLTAMGDAADHASVESEEIWHIVEAGDTLYDLARKYRTTVRSLQQKNGLKGSRLRIGQQLKI